MCKDPSNAPAFPHWPASACTGSVTVGGGRGGEGGGRYGRGCTTLWGPSTSTGSGTSKRKEEREKEKKKKGLAGVCHLSGALLYLAFSDKGTSTRARQSNWKPWVAAGSRLGWWRRVLRAKQSNATQRNATCRSQLLAHLGFGRR